MQRSVVKGIRVAEFKLKRTRYCDVGSKRPIFKEQICYKIGHLRPIVLYLVPKVVLYGTYKPFLMSMLKKQHRLQVKCLILISCQVFYYLAF